MPATIQGLGTAVPEHTMSLQEATELGVEICCENPRDAKRLEIMYQKSSVRNRHTVLPYQTAFSWLPHSEQAVATTEQGPTTGYRMQLYADLALELAVQSSEAALENSGLRRSRITHVVTVSCTGFGSPGVDIGLINSLGLSPTTERVNVGFMGCHGAVNGMRVARAIADADPDARVLLCAVELCCLHFSMTWDPQRMIANALFGDGSAALVIGGDEQPGRRIAATGSCLIDDSLDAMTWQIGDHGFEMTLDVSVPTLIECHLRDWLTEWLAKEDLGLADIGGWCVHPGGPKILSSVENALSLPTGATDNSRAVLAELSNMSSPTVLFVLERFWRQQSTGPFVVLGFGPGLVAEAALIR